MREILTIKTNKMKITKTQQTELVNEIKETLKNYNYWVTIESCGGRTLSAKENQEIENNVDEFLASLTNAQIENQIIETAKEVEDDETINLLDRVLTDFIFYGSVLGDYEENVTVKVEKK